MGLRTELEENDSKLVYYIREGNEEAKEFLYKKYSPLIHKEINRVKKRAFAYGVEYSDLVQEAMLVFSQVVNTYNEVEEVKFLTFATTCLRRKLTSYVEKLETTKNKNSLKMLALDSQLINDEKSVINQIEGPISNEPLKKLINNETLGEVSKRIEEKLSSKEKIVLNYCIEGKSVKEIADIMKLSSKQVYNLIHRARKKIKGS